VTRFIELSVDSGGPYKKSKKQILIDLNDPIE
jgi:hypothetical protein